MKEVINNPLVSAKENGYRTWPLTPMAVMVVLALIIFSVTGATKIAYGAPIVYTAHLNGANQLPANASLGTGLARVTIDAEAHTMRVEVTFSGLTGTVTAAHIHSATTAPGTGTIGVATQTPSFTGFPISVPGGSYDHTFDMTLTSSYSISFVNANGGTAASAEAALFAGIDAYKAYFNIHTTIFPGGEIRGFLAPHTISGNAGITGATLSYTDVIAKTVTSDVIGNYIIGVPAGWSGTITPSKAGFAFNPANRTYNSVQADQIAQDYTACFSAVSKNFMSDLRYDLLQDALDTAGNGHVLGAQAVGSGEDLDLRNGADFSLIGGYDCHFLQLVPGELTGVRSLTITNGTLTIENIKISGV